MPPAYEELAARITHARRLTILTGAGVSAASGVSTFRGADGLWRRVRPEDLATAKAFRRDPQFVWEGYAWRRSQIAACRPNAAHDVIAAWSRRQGCTVVTQNVDDLHVRAGTHNLVRLHGSIWELACWQGCGQRVWRDEALDMAAGPRGLPTCPACGGLARPAVVWFGEGLDPAHVAAALRATNCDLFNTAGTSAVVHPAAGLVDHARRRGAFTIEINPEATPASSTVHAVLREPAEIALPLLQEKEGRRKEEE